MNRLSCRSPYQTLYSLNASPWLIEKPFFLTKRFVASPSKNRLPSHGESLYDADPWKQWQRWREDKNHDQVNSKIELMRLKVVFVKAEDQQLARRLSDF